MIKLRGVHAIVKSESTASKRGAAVRRFSPSSQSLRKKAKNLAKPLERREGSRGSEDQNAIFFDPSFTAALLGSRTLCVLIRAYDEHGDRPYVVTLAQATMLRSLAIELMCLDAEAAGSWCPQRVE